VPLTVTPEQLAKSPEEIAYNRNNREGTFTELTEGPASVSKASYGCGMG